MKKKRNRKNKFKKAISKLSLLFFALFLIVNSFFIVPYQAEAVTCGACHIVSDISKTSLFRTAKTAFNSAVNFLNKLANASLLTLYAADHAQKFIAEILKTRLINSLTQETINFIQGKTDGQLKFVTDLNNYLNGPENYENLPAVLSAAIEQSNYPPAVKEVYKDFYQTLDKDISSSENQSQENQTKSETDFSSKSNLGYKVSNDGCYEMNWDSLSDNLNPAKSTDPDTAVINAYLAFEDQAKQKQEQKKLLYQAGQGFVPQTLNIGCDIQDGQGNCILPRKIITTPGKVFASMIANIADAHIKRIVNAENLENFLVIVANSFIDKLVSSGNGGLLGVRMGQFVSSNTSQEFQDVDKGSASNNAGEWLMWKEKSRSLLQSKIITGLEELRRCLASKNDSIMIREVNKKLNDFENRLKEINKSISLVENNYASYSSQKYGSVNTAKEQYNGLKTSADEISRDLFQCAKTADDDTVSNLVSTKQVSYDTIMQAPGGIIYYIDKFIGYYKENGGGSVSYWESKKRYYLNLANEIKHDIDQVRSNPLTKHSSTESAKNEYNSLKSTANNYKKNWESLTNQSNNQYGSNF